MADLTFTRDASKPFSTFGMSRQILGKLADITTQRENIAIHVDGLNNDESLALTSIILQAFATTFANTREHSGKGIETVSDPIAGSSTTTIPGFGKIKATYDKGKKQTTMSFPAYDGDSLPVYQMLNILKTMETQLAEAPDNGVLPHDGRNYSVLLFPMRELAEIAMKSISALVHAQGHNNPSDIFTAYSGVQTPDGKYPAILIEENVLQDVLQKEFGGRGKPR